MYTILFLSTIIIVVSFSLPVYGDVADEIKNIRDDLKFILDDLQKIILKQNKKMTASLDSIQIKLNDFEIDQANIALSSNQTFEECSDQNKNFTTNFEEILNKVENIDDVRKDVSNIEIKNQNQLDEIKNVQSNVQNILTKLTGIENTLTNAIQTHEDTQNRKLTDFENKMTNSLKDINDQYQTYLINLKKMEDNVEKVLNKIIDIESQNLNLAIKNINKAVLDNENNQNKKFDQLTLKITTMQTDLKTNNNLNQQNSNTITNVQSNLADVTKKLNDLKIENENGRKHVLNTLTTQISDVKNAVSNGQNLNSQNTRSINNGLQKIQDLAVKVASTETSLTGTITSTGQNLKNILNTLQGKVTNIEQNSVNNNKINEIYRIADYMKRVACSAPFVKDQCNQHYF